MSMLQLVPCYSATSLYIRRHHVWYRDSRWRTTGDTARSPGFVGGIRLRGPITVASLTSSGIRTYGHTSCLDYVVCNWQESAGGVSVSCPPCGLCNMECLSSRSHSVRTAELGQVLPVCRWLPESRYGTRKLVSQRRSQCRRPAFAHECQQDQGTQAQRLCTLILLAFRCKSWSTALWTVKSTCKYWHQLSASSARHAISSLLLTAGCQWLTILCQSVVQHRLWWMRRSRWLRGLSWTIAPMWGNCIGAMSTSSLPRCWSRHRRVCSNRLTCRAVGTKTRLSDRSLAVAGPRAWNTLQTPLRLADDWLLAVNKRLLKAHLFD